MKKKIQLSLLVLVILQLLGMLCVWQIRNVDTLRLECGNDRLAFYYQSAGRSYSDGTKLQIMNYRSEDTGEYYLFFPSCFENPKCRLQLVGTDEVMVNEKAYRTDSAVQFLEEGRYSLAANGSFYILNVMYGSEIPSVFIDLSTDDLPHLQESKEHTDCGYLNMYDAQGDVQYQDGLLDIHGRGNSSWEYQQQKGYSIALAAKGALVDGSISDKWNLIGNGYDHSLIENQMMYELAGQAGLSYSPKLSPIELYIEGEYVGVYLLTTKIRVNESSVSIDNLGKETELLNELPLYEYENYGEAEPIAGQSKGFLIPDNPGDITGGYLIEQDHADRYAAEASGFSTGQGNGFVIKSPEYASREQAEYIRSYVQEITDAIAAEDGRNPDTGKYYDEYIDVESFIKNYMLQEVTKNMDMNLTSQFFYKPRGEASLLYAGPVWDFDYTFGMSDAVVWDTALDDPQGLLAEYSCDPDNRSFSFAGLYWHKSFRERVSQLYRSGFRERLYELLETGIDNYAADIEQSAAMNHARWEIEEPYTETVDGIRQFLRQRLEFLDGVW